MSRLVSVIVPVYNVEQYLERCVQSIVGQTYKNIEIILVDDGSPDRCPELCEEWAVKDSRIKVVHKQNAGLGCARNTGIDYATGDYLFFIDSDDYIALDAIEKVMKTAERTGAEIIQFGNVSVDNNDAVRRQSIPRMEKEVYRSREVTDIVLPNMIAADSRDAGRHLELNAWSNAYSSKLIQRSNWRFISEREIISEDYYSILWLMKDVRSFAIVPEAFYYYCMNNNSLSRCYRSDRFAQQKKFYTACMEVCEKAAYSQEVKERIAHLYMDGIIGILHMYFMSNLSGKDKKQAMKEVICDDDLQQIIHCMDISREPFKKRLLYIAIRRSWTGAVYLLLQARYGCQR